jgi:hypothetical protein
MGMNENRPAARKRLWQSLGVAAAFVAMLLAGHAQASDAARPASLREIAPNVRAFASDGSRYAAWQETESSPIVVLDVASGQTRNITTSGCELESRGEHISPAAFSASRGGGGRFFLACDGYVQDVLNVQTGQVQPLPAESTRYQWSTVGALYAEDSNYLDGCTHTGDCIALYDLATGTLSERHTLPLLDLNRPGAPSLTICPALRHRVLTAEYEAPPNFAYENGVYGHLVKHTHVEIDRCKRPPIVLATKGEPRDFNLSDGLLSWDTGYPTGGFLEEDESRSPSVLTVYQPATGKRRHWRLPERFVPNAEPERSTLGYSTHTANTVFWIADRSVRPERIGFEVETYALYSAKF